jgi:hypothetical protein
METARQFIKKMPLIGTLLLLIMLLVSCQPARSERAKPDPEKDKNIMLAILLDTSNSMDGLIDQAKSQLWKIVNDLAEAKCNDGSKPQIKIALYEYGNDGLMISSGYIRQVSPFTTDLDLISEKLFALRTNGGSEYCGYVINTSIRELAWSSSPTDLKIIFIAGNEPFTQGPIPFQEACSRAKEKGVVVNTIYCGEFSEGVETSWKRGADLTGGSYMSIEQDRKTVYIPSPYDDQIEALNERLNNTYIYYGKTGSYKKDQQKVQDDNAEQYGKSNKVERAVSKTTHAYKNSSWDLVDAATEDERVVEKTEEEYLPAEMKRMTIDQRKSYIQEKSKERASIQKEIHVLSEKRKTYIAQHQSGQQTEMLDEAMLRSIKEKGKEKDLTWK